MVARHCSPGIFSSTSPVCLYQVPFPVPKRSAAAFLHNSLLSCSTFFPGTQSGTTACHTRRPVLPLIRPSRINMGIKGLTKLIGDNAPRAIIKQEVKSLFGRTIAIDASMCIYQLLVAVRVGADNLTNDDGEITSHLNGLFYRTIRLLELGIKPIYVFDGKPPSMKSGELAKRNEAKKAAEEAAKKAREEGDLEMEEKFSRRVNRVTPAMFESCKRLLRLMGIPVVEAPCEAEAQCAELVKNGEVYATASEDMDSLTFGTTRLIRYLWQGTASTAGKKGIVPTDFSLPILLEDLDLSMSQFIDLCILCGCDYVDGIRGVGVVKALNLMRKHDDLEKVVAALRNEKSYSVPDPYPVEALREMFLKPEVTPAKEVSLKWSRPDTKGVLKFMVDENQFEAAKMETGIKRLTASKQKSSQVRVDSFFKRVSAPNEAERKAKRKATVEAAKATKLGKKGKSNSTPIKPSAAKKRKT